MMTPFSNYQTRVATNSTDSEQDIIKSQRALFSDALQVVYDWEANPRNSREVGDALLKEIASAIGLKSTQVEMLVSPSIETKQKQEALARNADELDRYLSNFFGQSSIDLINSVKQEFSDTIADVAYYDIGSGRLRVQTNESLNYGIRKMKSELYATMLDYLRNNPDTKEKVKEIPYELYDKDFGFDAMNYYTVMSLFESEIAKEKFVENVTGQHANERTRINDERANATRAYCDLMEKIKNNDESTAKAISNRISRLFGSDKSIGATMVWTTLYQADHPSLYYRLVDEVLTAQINGGNGKAKDERDALRRIVRAKNSLLNAAKAYVKLKQFDAMLRDSFGDSINTTSGTFGFEVNAGDKYSYHQDTSHEIKGWQTSEDVGSEKHTAKLTRAIIDTIRVYDFNTGAFMNRRMNPNMLINATMGLFDAINYGTLQGTTVDGLNRLKKLVRQFYDDPVTNLQAVLETLFKDTDGDGQHVTSIASTISSGINTFDLSVLKSLYDVAFNMGNPGSFYRQTITSAQKNDVSAQKLIEAIAGYVSRNVTASYLDTTIDYETGVPQLKAKDRFFTGKDAHKLRVSVNRNVNELSPDKRLELQRKYNFRSADSGNHQFTATILNEDGSELITIVSSTTSNSGGLFDRKWNNVKIVLPADSNSERKTVTFDSLDSAIASNDVNNIYVPALLTFYDDILGLNLNNAGFERLAVLGQIRPGKESYMQEFAKMAMRAMFVNDNYIDYEEHTKINPADTQADKDVKAAHVSLGTFVGYGKFEKLVEEGNATMKFGRYKYVTANNSDRIINDWADAMAIYNGDAAKATTKDREGNTLPNNSVAKMGSMLHYYLGKQVGTNVSDLLFVDNPDMVVNIFHDQEAANAYGDHKSISAFTNSELFYHAIFNKFWGRYSTNKTLIIQPTTYADKTTFLNYEINPLTREFDFMDPNASEDTLLSHYARTIGKAATTIRDTTESKLRTIVDKFKETTGRFANIEDFRDCMAQMTEKELVDAAERCSETVTLHKDYKIINRADGKKGLGVNYLVWHNADLFSYSKGSNEMLKKKLTHEKLLFMSQLLRNNCTFQVLEGGETVKGERGIENYHSLDDIRSKNPVINAARVFYKADDLIAFLNNWVDADTGKLIMAKQGTGKNKKNIISVSDTIDMADEKHLELNPLLDRFFMIESLLSNNLRLSMTGFETSHPENYKVDSPLRGLLKASRKGNIVSMQDILRKNGVDEDNINGLCEVLGTTNNPGLLANVYDLYSLGKAINSLSQKDKNRKELQRIFDKTVDFEMNTSQGTQLKRNVIIPATLQSPVSMALNAPPAKVRVAVIRDEEAHVYNYRGDHDGDLTSSDGSAQITPFQCIMENRGLGPQAVGFTKKPIWHNYDAASGTSFLAKFATYTMTNEAMRSSLLSKTSLYRMFKKATNRRWSRYLIDANGNPLDVDLTKSITASESYGGNSDHPDWHDTWVKDTLFGGKSLYYTDKYGGRHEITGFNKEDIALPNHRMVRVYYTDENIFGKAGRVYHLFDSSSTHITADSVEAVKNLLSKDPNLHTIDSLFELHAALGGVYCVDSKGNSSEYNNEVVVNFMTYVGWVRPGIAGSAKKLYVDQRNFRQPLKECHIGYLFNESGVKEGVKNINQADVWNNDDELATFELDMMGLGMQMNADHDIIDSELTEFSQVIAATAAYGYTFDQCSEIFKGLALTAHQASERTLTAVDNFLRAIANGENKQAVSGLYDAVGRLLLSNRSLKDKENLTTPIMNAVEDVFNKYMSHDSDTSKIPFSDPNIYSDFLATLASTINKQSIKRKHPGTGAVMIPSYNIMQYFEVPSDENGNFEKLTTSQLLDRARKQYRADLTRIAERVQLYKEGTNINRKSLSSLEKDLIAKGLDLSTETPLYTTAQDAGVAATAMISAYLKSKERMMPVHTDRTYFQPSDVVDVLDAEGNIIETVDLDNLATYYKFLDGNFQEDDEFNKKRSHPVGATYRLSVTSPRNLRPSLIRWQYLGADNNLHYMNVFALKVIRNAYEQDHALNTEYRSQVQKALDNIEKGIFYDNDDKLHYIAEGTLENQAAELIMGNIYKEIFNIGDESLQDVLAQGEDYFKDREGSLVPPSISGYDLAFMRGNGKHVLISTGVVTEGNTVVVNPFKNTMINADGTVYCTFGERRGFAVAKWINSTDTRVSWDADSQSVASSGKDNVDLSRFRAIQDSEGNVTIQERVDLVNRYNVNVSKKVGDTQGFVTDTLYNIANLENFKKAFNLTDDNQAKAEQVNLIQSIFNVSDFKLAQANYIGERNTVDVLSAVFDKFIEANHGNSNYIRFLVAQKNLLNSTRPKENETSGDTANGQATTNENTGKNTGTDKAVDIMLDALTEYKNAEAHRKWVSFQDSLKFIAARIPAQTLQSFMAMKCIGWTENSKNMAYVSHFQCYLQGSDYDIDKAYIMGQNYDSNGIYVGWSNLFDYSSLETLEASKELPVPKGIELKADENGADITRMINDIERIATIDEQSGELVAIKDENNLSLENQNKVKLIKGYVNLIRAIENADGRYTISGPVDSTIWNKVRDNIQKHESYQVPISSAESAFKNVASANIYAVSHAIRNRDQAYSPVSMSTMRKSADNSPKGEQTTNLCMLNPLMKYIMQYQNIVGKNVIGIAANGEKFWFNTYYYWTKLLKEGNEKAIPYLRFQTTLNRVKGRAIKRIVSNTVKCIPDLDTGDPAIRNSLGSYGLRNTDIDNLQYEYTDLKISELLSAATDNAKELILAKLNAGTNYARMYLYLMATGYSIADIAAFMTSPVAELIDTRSMTNMFQPGGRHNDVAGAVNSGSGKVNSRNFLHGTISQEYDLSSIDVDKITVAKGILLKVLQDPNSLSRLGDMVAQYLINNGQGGNVTGELFSDMNLDDLMQAVILTRVSHGQGAFMDIFKDDADMKDFEISTYFRFCSDLATQLHNTVEQYMDDNNRGNYREVLQEVLADANEFKKIYDLSSEMSSVATGLLSLNQGIPTDKLGLLKKCNSISRMITDRERVLGIRAKELFTEGGAIKEEAFNKVLSSIRENNPWAGDDSRIRDVFSKAHGENIMEHFDVLRMLTDDDYKQVAKDYVDIIKGTVNVIDMIDNLPHYRAIMDCFKAVLQTDQTLAVKGRVINKLMDYNQYLSDAQLSGAIRYVDNLITMDFLKNMSPIMVRGKIAGFDYLFNSQDSVSSFNLSTAEGLAGFKHFMEHEFFTYLKDHHSTQSLVKHLVKLSDNDRTVIATDIDLLNPTSTTYTRAAYDEILQGMSEFAGTTFGNNDFGLFYEDKPMMITDLLQLYNLIVNRNQYGSERLTTAFKNYGSTDSILSQYYKYVSGYDYGTKSPETDKNDFDINTAPTISEAAERYHNEPFIKVRDNTWGYIIKKKNTSTNTYSEYPIVPTFSNDNVDAETRNQRKANFAEYCPIEMPGRMAANDFTRSIAFNDPNNQLDDATKESMIREALLNLAVSGKLMVVKYCK